MARGLSVFVAVAAALLVFFGLWYVEVIDWWHWAAAAPLAFVLSTKQAVSLSDRLYQRARSVFEYPEHAPNPVERAAGGADFPP